MERKEEYRVTEFYRSLLKSLVIVTTRYLMLSTFSRSVPSKVYELKRHIFQVYIDNGYLHDGRAGKNPYPHDGHADKDSYPHDSNNQCIILRLQLSFVMNNVQLMLV